MSQAHKQPSARETIEFLAEAIFEGPGGILILQPFIAAISAMGYDGAKYVVNTSKFEELIKNCYSTHIGIVLWSAKKLNSDAGEFIADMLLTEFKEEIAKVSMRRFQEYKEHLAQEMGGNISSHKQASPPQTMYSQIDFDMEDLLSKVKGNGSAN